MAPTKMSVREILNPDSKDFIFIEQFIDTDSLLPDGFLGKIFAAAELSTFISCRPEAIFPVPIIEFYGTFDKDTTSSTRISTRQGSDHGGDVLLGSSSVSWMDLATTKLGLRDDGRDVEKAGCSDLTAELRRFSENPMEVFSPGKTMTKCLKPIFKILCDIVSKVILSHVGSISSVTKSKLMTMAALVDELKGIKSNWAKFIIKQWMEVAKEIKATSSPYAFEMGTRLRFGSKLSFALTSMCPNLDRRFSAPARANPLFPHQVDVPISSVAVPNAIASGEKRKEAASPLKPIPKGKRTKRSKQAKTSRRKLILDDEEEEEEEEADSNVESVAHQNIFQLGPSVEDSQLNQELLDTIFEGVEVEDDNAEGEAADDQVEQEHLSFDSSIHDAITAFQFAPEAECSTLDEAKQQAELERIAAGGEVSQHFSGVELTEEQSRLLTEFLVYTRVRGTEYYKLFEMIDAVGREELKRKELSLLATFKASGFGDFIDSTTVWRKMEEFVAQTVPNLYNIIPKRPSTQEAGQSVSAELTYLANVAKEASAAYKELQESIKKKEEDLKLLQSNLAKELEFNAQLEKEKAEAIEAQSLAVTRLESQTKNDEAIRAELQAAYNSKIAEADERYANLQSKVTELEHALSEAKRVINGLEASADTSASEIADMTIKLVSLDLEKAEAEEMEKRSEKEKVELIAEVARLKEELAAKDAIIAELREPSAEIESLKAMLIAKDVEKAKAAEESRAFIIQKHAEFTEAIPHVLNMEPYLKNYISKRIDQVIHSTCGNILAQFKKGATADAPRAHTQSPRSGALVPTRTAGMTPGVIAKGEGTVSLEKKSLEKKASEGGLSQIPVLVQPLRQVPLKGVVIGEPQAEKPSGRATGGAMGGEASSVAGKGKGKVVVTPEPTKQKKIASVTQEVPPSDVAVDEEENLEAIYNAEAAARKESLRVEFELKRSRCYRNLYLKFAPTTLNERRALTMHARRLTIAEMNADCRRSDQIEAVKVATEKTISEFFPKLTVKQKLAQDKLMKKILERSQEEIVAKQVELGIKRVEEVLPEEHLAEWRKAEVRFIKLYHFWGIYHATATNAFVGFMEQFHKSLWTIILEKLGDSFVLAPEKRLLEAPCADGIIDKSLIDREVRELLSIQRIEKPSFPQLHEAKRRVNDAYGIQTPRL